MGVVWIFSGTTQSVEGTWICIDSYGWFRGKWVKLPGAGKLHSILQTRLQIYNENVDDLLSTKIIKDHS